MPDSGDFNVVLGADISDLTEKMDEAKESVASAGEEMAAAGEKGGEGAEGLDEMAERAGEAMENLGEQAKESVEKFALLGEGLKGVAEIMGIGFLGEAIEKSIGEFINLGTEVQRTATI